MADNTADVAERRVGTTIEFKDVTKVFKQGKKEVHALKNVTTTIPGGTIVGIIGYSGAGKSTLRSTAWTVRPAGRSSSMAKTSCRCRSLACASCARTSA